MAQPVWVLSVDLQAKTATFQSGMAEAAKSARGAFTEIKSGSAEAGGAVATNMFEARHGVMLLGEEFGIRLPRALTAFITSIGPVGAAMEAAFPFLAIAVGATLLIEALVKMHEAGAKLTEDQIKFGTAIETAFNQLDQKLLQAEIRTDELRNDHLGALHHQLQLINMQSMNELVHSFGEIAKAADVVFDGLKSHWFTFGIGATGAKHALDDFQTKYDDLLAHGKDSEAADLLKGTRESAEHTLAMMKQAKDSLAAESGSSGTDVDDSAKYMQATNELKKAGVGTTEKEVKAQQALVEALQAQVGIEERVTALKKQDDGNASATTAKEMAALRAEGAREAAEHARKMGEIAVQVEREQGEAALAIRSANVAEKLALDLHLADEEYRIQETGNRALIAALDKGGKDYNNQLRSLQDKGAELTAQHTATVATLTAKAEEAGFRESLQNLVQAEREKIEATEQGSRARLAAIDAALKEEAGKNLQDTANYRDLMKQRVETLRQATTEERKLAAEVGKEEAEQALKMGQLLLAADKQSQALLNSSHHVSTQQRITQETQAADAEFLLKQRAMRQEAAALDKTGKDYANQLKAIQNQELQLVREHENELTAIKSKAEIERNQRILSAENQFNDQIARGLTQVLMGHKSFASMMNSLGDQVVSGMFENAVKSAMADDMTKEKDAAAAARKAYLSGSSVGGPAGLILGPVMGAAAFTAVMAFAGGGVVPGTGMGDTVPAMLEPGEGIIKNSAMDKINRGDLGNTTHHYHVTAHFAPNVQAIDADGVDKMLDKHGDKFQRKLETSLRRMNH